MAPLAQQFSYLPINTESLKVQVCVAKEMFNKSETIVTTPEDVLQLLPLHPTASAFPMTRWANACSGWANFTT